MWDFEQGRAGRDFDISYTLPSVCAHELQSGAADIGIIPAAAYTQIPDLKILPNVAIASRNSVRSILLVSRMPLEKIGTVALDTSSMTSVALTKILFEKWLGGGRSFAPMAPDLEKMLATHDAALIIGDPALQIDRSRYFTLDLAEEWIRFTGKPFVFAFWAVRRDAIAETKLDLTAIFQRSRDHGLHPANIEQIGHEWAPQLGIAELTVQTYLTQNIYYYLDSSCLEGLRLFYQYGSEIGVLPAPPSLTFFAPANVATV